MTAYAVSKKDKICSADCGAVLCISLLIKKQVASLFEVTCFSLKSIFIFTHRHFIYHKGLSARFSRFNPSYPHQMSIVVLILKIL